MEDELITYLFPDINAVKSFQKEFETLNEFHIVEPSISSGFDIYLVEQWANNRNIGSIISTYTGNFNNEINIVKFTIKKLPSKKYPLIFQEYLNELMINHAKIKYMNHEETEILFITNITSLPSHLSLIPILNGNFKAIEDNFIINSNLKKLQCSGRSISLITPKISDANEDKFRQMYKIYNLNIPIRFAIKELINIIQTCLFYFDLLDIRYCDGFLCNKTEDAIVNWWNLIGLPHFNVKPPGILPARTVSAIISLVSSIKIRLQLFGGCDVPRDPFDVENFMISIGEFQRHVKLDKTRKLDIETFHKLLYITNKKLKLPEIDKKSSSYTKEFRKLTNVVKNTVQDRIYDEPKMEFNVETLDLELLIGNLLGKTLKRLWQGIDVQSPSIQQDNPSHLPHTYQHHHHHHHHHLHDTYKFVSLKDFITKSQKIHYDKKTGLNRMKLGRYKQQKLNLNHQKSHRDINLTGLSKVDQLLQIKDHKEPKSPIDKNFGCGNGEHKELLVHKFYKGLNRRNSYPSTSFNLSILMNNEFERPKLKRCKSFNDINNLTMEKLSITYLDDMNKLIELDNLKKTIKKDKFKINFNQLNEDLNKLKVYHNILENNQENLVKQDLPNIIEFNMNNLSTNLDRLIYESRIIIKRVYELESNSKILKNKLKDQSLDKLSTTINSLIYLNKLNKVFEKDERDDIILRLTNNNQDILNMINSKENEIPQSFLRIMITFIWDMMFFIFELFKFDRSKMNVDRIRQSWVKLDPNRKYIEKAYDFVGYDSTTSL